MYYKAIWCSRDGCRALTRDDVKVRARRRFPLHTYRCGLLHAGASERHKLLQVRNGGVLGHAAAYLDARCELGIEHDNLSDLLTFHLGRFSSTGPMRAVRKMCGHRCIHQHYCRLAAAAPPAAATAAAAASARRWRCTNGRNMLSLHDGTLWLNHFGRKSWSASSPLARTRKK